MIGEVKPATSQRAFARKTVLILVISLASGLVAYGFNLALDFFYGPQTLARVLAALGAAATIGLPASLVSLPLVAWAGQSRQWRRRLPAVQFGFLALGALSALGVFLIRQTFPAQWLLPIGLLIALSSYLPAVATGSLVGRAAFVASAVVGLLPNLLRFVGVLAIGRRDGGVTDIFWAQALSFALAGVVGLALPYMTANPDAVRPVKATPWASGWVALSVMAWLSVDIFVATVHLGASRAAGFAVIALLGKAPFYLAQPVVLMVIGEEGWGERRRRAGALAIAAIAAASLLGAALLGQFVMRLMGVSLPWWLLAAYFAGACALSLSYLWSGAAAQRQQHHWWPLLAACALWVAFAMVHGDSTGTLIYAFLVAQLLGLGGTLALSRVAQHGGRRRATANIVD